MFFLIQGMNYVSYRYLSTKQSSVWMIWDRWPSPQLSWKCAKKIVLNNSKPHVEKHLDPCQFAYQEGRWAGDAMVSKLNCIYTHLHTSGGFVKMLYYDLSSAFNTNSTTYHGWKSHTHEGTRGVQFIYFTFFREPNPICQVELNHKFRKNDHKYRFSPRHSFITFLIFYLHSRLPPTAL